MEIITLTTTILQIITNQTKTTQIQTLIKTKIQMAKITKGIQTVT